MWSPDQQHQHPWELIRKKDLGAHSRPADSESQGPERSGAQQSGFEHTLLVNLRQAHI